MRTEQRITQLLAQRAAELRENLKSGEHRDRAALDAWLRDSKLHVEAYLDITALDRHIEALDESYRPDLEAALASVGANVHELQQTRASTNPPVEKMRRRMWSLAAAVVGLMLLGGLAAVAYRSFLSSAQHYTTAAGERHTVTLPDGSTIEMNVDTSVHVEFGRRRRSVDLLSGEAVFKVAHDTGRPFIVHTRTADVRAVGTQFNVYQRQSTVVSVLEGRVQVTTAPAQVSGSAAPEPPAAASLDAGEEAKIEPGKIEKRAHADVSKTVAWRVGRIYFDDLALDEIVREFNRYGGTIRVRMEGIPPGAYHFGGTFNATDPASLADVVEQQPELIVERRPGEIVIRPRPVGGEPQQD